MENEIVATTQDTVDNSVQEAQPETNGTPTISDTFTKQDDKNQTVGLDKYLSEKRERKAVETKLAELQAKVDAGMSNKEYSNGIEKLADKYDLDKNFLAELKEVDSKSIEDKINERLRPFEEEKEKARIETIFSKNFSQAIDNMPEYKNVVNPEVIKQLSLLRDTRGNLVNGHKNIEQLIEETYANSLGGKRTLETTTPRGGKDTLEVDFDLARRDTTYFKEVMANPNLKAVYNRELEKRIGL